jgi:hypothetical protein
LSERAAEARRSAHSFNERIIMRTLAQSCLKIAFTVFLLSAGAFACQPCESTLTLEQSAGKAELIIVGDRLDFSPSEVEPQSIKVRVLSILKGKADKKIIVRSWYQMCPYGIIVDNQRYVMFLTKSAEMPGMYEAVEGGCGVKTLSVRNKVVLVEGKRMSIAELREKYKL